MINIYGEYSKQSDLVTFYSKCTVTKDDKDDVVEFFDEYFAIMDNVYMSDDGSIDTIKQELRDVQTDLENLYVKLDTIVNDRQVTNEYCVKKLRMLCYIAIMSEQGIKMMLSSWHDEDILDQSQLALSFCVDLAQEVRLLLDMEWEFYNSTNKEV